MSKGVRSLLACGMLAALVLLPGSPATAASNVHAMKVFVGYADGIRGDSTVPSLWDRDRGCPVHRRGRRLRRGRDQDREAVTAAAHVDDVSVEIGSATYDLWGPYPIVVAGKSSVVLTQTVQYDFDTSEPATATCEPSGDIPLVHIVIGSRNPKTRTFTDAGQVLNTGGVDPGACTGANEGHDWVRIHGHD